MKISELSAKDRKLAEKRRAAYVKKQAAIGITIEADQDDIMKAFVAGDTPEGHMHWQLLHDAKPGEK